MANPSSVTAILHSYIYDEIIHCFMPKVKIHHHLIKKQKIRPYVIKGVGNQIAQKKNQQLDKNYNDAYIYEGNRFFVVYEFQEEQGETITFVREMKKAVKK